MKKGTKDLCQVCAHSPHFISTPWTLTRVHLANVDVAHLCLTPHEGRERGWRGSKFNRYPHLLLTVDCVQCITITITITRPSRTPSCAPASSAARVALPLGYTRLFVDATVDVERVVAGAEALPT